MKRKDLFDEREVELMENYWKEDRKPRQNLLDFIKIVDKGEAKKGVEGEAYILLDPCVTDEMLEVLVHTKLRKPTYIEDLAKLSGKSIEETARICEECGRVGVLEFKEDKKGVDMVEVPVFCVGQLEMIMVTPEYYDKHPEQSVLFQHYTHGTSTGAGTFLPMTNHGVHRTVPIESALENDTKRMGWEQLSTLLEDYGDDDFALAPCMCRKSMQTLGKGAGEPELYWCMMIGHFARYTTRAGKAKPITRQQALDKLKEAENRGFVHNVANANGRKIEYVCNCDFRSCFESRAALVSGNASMVRSNFTAQVDPEKCVACGRCVEKCPMNAVKMGQRLTPKVPKTYHYSDTPYMNFKWGKEHHDMQYGFHRENVWEETGTAPCKTACPAHIAVEGYLKLASQGRYEDALKLIKYNNPLPAVCGAICNRRCESACTRGKIDNPVAIDEVKKFLAERDLHAETRYVPKKIRKLGKKVAIIGGGPAGLSCAYYSAVNGHDVTVFDRNEKAGGMLRYGIPSFRLEKDVLDGEIAVLEELGVTFRYNTEVGRDLTIQDLRDQGFAAIYVAIGMQGGRKLGVLGEDVEGVVPGVEFMRQAAIDGIGHCAGNVVVVGGGNVAIDVARTALRSGANHVDLFCLESRDSMPAADDEIAEAEKEGVTINCGWGPKEILGTDGHVSGISFKKCLSVFDEEHRFSPKFDENDVKTLDVDYVLTSIGQSVVWNDLLNDTSVTLNRNQTAQADSFTYQTAEPDIFVGGDVYTGARFAIDAIAAGKEAAESIQRYVWNGSLTFCRDRNLYQEIDKDGAEYGSFDNSDRQIPGTNAAKQMSFHDERETFTEEQVKTETSRCLQCGASHVDENLCLGCGVCTTRCEFDAIHLRKVYDLEPVPREKLVPSVLKEIGRRKIQDTFHKPEQIEVPVGLDANKDWMVSKAFRAGKQDKVHYEYGADKGIRPLTNDIRVAMATKCTEYTPESWVDMEDKDFDWHENKWAKPTNPVVKGMEVEPD